MSLFKNQTRLAMAYTNEVGDKIYPVIVDIKKGIKSTEEIQFMSSDINTGVLSVAFIQGNDNYNVSGAEVICSVMRPDASTLELPCDIVRDNVVEVPLGINGTSQDGVYSFDFKVFKGGNKVVGTPIMNYSVSLSIGNDAVVEEDDRLPVLTVLMTQLTEIKDEAREAINQANTATESTREATAKAIEATNKANETVNKVTQDTSNAIAEVNATSDTMVENVNNAISSMDTTVNNKISEMTDTVNNKISEVDTVKNDMINDVSSTKANMVTEVTNAKNEMTATVTNKVNEVEGRFNALTASQQQSSEVIDARDGETSLKARLDRDIEKAKQVYVNVEGSHISTDSSSGYAKDVEILGNTVQDAENLADIRSVGDKVEGQELYEIPVVSVGKNLFDKNKIVYNKWIDSTGNIGIGTGSSNTRNYLDYTEVVGGCDLKVSGVNITAFFVYSDIGVYLPSDFNYASNTITLPQNAKFIRFTFDSTKDFSNVQIEYGAQATPYEPYVEDKLTILSPVQLEKVGNVADRIIEKDGVWGVEKSISTVTFDGSESWNRDPNDTNTTSNIILLLETSNIPKAISNIFIYQQQWCNGKEHFYLDVAGKSIVVEILKSRLETDTTNGFKKWLSENNLVVKYIAKSPQFIPLPHSQQIKLRTFADKTNISFGCEIEGTIKAQVPKSIGATVNTHTEQINNLNKELDRVKKLEESTVSTVTTESDFTTVEATSNGYFEDVKLEGKTLVNLYKQYSSAYTLPWNLVDETSIRQRVFRIDTQYILDSSKIYTIILNLSNIINPENNAIFVNYNTVDGTPKDTSFIPKNGINIITLTQIASINNIRIQQTYVESGMRGVLNNLIILEGDHTQNPPSIFEGLKSVGQSASEDGVDEIVVSSVNENLFDGNFTIEGNLSRSSYINVKGNDKVTINLSTSYEILDVNKLRIFNDWTETGIIQIPKNGHYLKFWKYTTDIEGLDIQVNRGGKIKPYTPHKQDKKHLLYYNNETQAWEKPILRQWDSIEKHADGKYYYHQRSGEVVLNGSESWQNATDLGNVIRAYITDISYEFGGVTGENLVCDKFVTQNNVNLNDETIWISSSVNRLGIHIEKSKLHTQDIVGFKQWLQANNVTVVYQLAQEKVYECTNIDLITYANETNYVVESGVLSPKSTLKVHNNISNVVSLLQKKVSLLENKFIQGLKQVLAGDMYSLAELLYPEDFKEENPENEIMLLPFE